MDHTAHSGHQRQRVSSSEVLRGDQGGSQNPDQSCYCDLAGTREGLCPNKVPRVKRQVASVSKKANEPPKSNNSNSLSGSQHPPKAKNTGTVTVKDQQYELPTSKPRSHKRRRRRGRPAHREEEDQVDNRSVKFLRPITAKPQAWEEGNPCYLAGSRHPPKVK